MKRFAIIALAAVSLSAAVFATDASARSGGHGMGNHGSSPRGSINTMLRQPKIDRPTLKFTKMKLLNCHKYARGTGQGGPINWVTVCS